MSSKRKVKISALLIKKLTSLKEPSTGKIYGVNLGKNDIVVLAFTLNDTADNRQIDGSLNLPANVDVCGIFNTHCDILALPDVTKNNDQRNEIVMYVTSAGNQPSVKAAWLDNPSEFVSYDTLTQAYLNENFIYLRVTADIDLSCRDNVESLIESLTSFQNKVEAGHALFQIKDEDIYITRNENKKSKTLQEFMQGKMKGQLEFIDINLFVSEEVKEQTPFVISIIQREMKILEMSVSLDTVGVVPVNTHINYLYDVLVSCVLRGFQLNKVCLTQNKQLSSPNVFHFFVEELGHLITVAYPQNVPEDQLVQERERLHKQFCLSLTRPYFRRCCAYTFNNNEDIMDDGYIVNPHVGVGPSGVKDGEIALVQGNYTYHHYMQDNFDDNGWGCAYRSLQTLFSWFRYQGFTNLKVPSLTEIQKCLVKIGDKPSSFVGSKKWIGSTEVGYCLDTMLGVSCRIISVSSGEELSTKGGELVYHFKNQGSPVMIGGGSYAHTIVGVDYNKKTGALKFMVLDPHYTGDDDLKIIHSKGWCAWKGLEFWKKDCFYNLCLPLRPKCI